MKGRIEKQFKMTAKTLFGLEEVLEKELQTIGAKDITLGKRAVYFEGDMELLMKANLSLRTALSILKPIHEFSARNEKKLYFNVRSFPWEFFIGEGQTFSMTVTINSDTFTHSKYVLHKTKDGIIDRLRDIRGERPSIDRVNPDIRINIHVFDRDFTISLDSSGEPLFKRSYRDPDARAPINECLAAGMILLTGWNGKTPFYNPMCGSGTIGIEAAMIATNKSPNLEREHFSFMNWREFVPNTFNQIKAELRNQESKCNVPIVLNDVNPVAFRKAQSSIRRAGVDSEVQLMVKDFHEMRVKDEQGCVILNPPYGERLELEEAVEFYQQMGDTLKSKFTGFDAWIISSNLEALKRLGLKAGNKIDLMNGELKCRYNHYELYKGSK